MTGIADLTRARHPRRAALACALATVLAACGGGGSGSGLVQPPSPPPLAPPPVTPPPATPPPAVVQPPNPAYSRHLADTNTGAAHAAGLTGQGVPIGFLDSGINRNHPALRARVTDNLIYVNRQTNNTSVDDVAGHGTAVAQAAAGQPFGAWPGGVAPGATLVSARIISDKPPVDDGSGNGNPVDGALGLEPIHRDLINRNVRIMNNSWGGLYLDNPAAATPIAAEYRPFVVQHGGLVVFASGNAERANPSDLAALPSQQLANGTRPGADLERGWLTVSALAEGSTAQLASYSNACGIAMRYCLVAPGTVVVTGTNDAPDRPEYWKYNGTSLAAPLVSGAAALVWEAFPYFNNDLVRQTLLGTATDIGAPGVDPVFGYGALNVGKAVRGPARFDWGDVTANFSGGTSVWGNDITGDGGLIKRGAGTLRLDGNASYRGATRVEGGTLVFAGQGPIAGAISVDTVGSLQWSGNLIGGNVLNRGSFALTGDTRARTITGNFEQTVTGRLAVPIGAPLSVSGSARLAGELLVTGVVRGYTYQSNETVVRAYGGLSGTFTSLGQGPGVFLDATLGYDSTRAWLDITRLDVAATTASLAGATAQAIGSAERIEGAFTALDAHDVRAIDTPFARTAGAFQRIQHGDAALAALDSLSGAQHTRALNATFDQVDMTRRAVAARVGEVAAHDARPGAWQQALGQGGDGGFAGDGFQVDGWSLGRDQTLGDGILAGFAFGELRGDGVMHARGDRSRDRQTQAQVYLARAFGDAYVMAQMGSGRVERDLRRQLFAGADWQGVSTRYAGDVSQAAVEVGRRWRLGATELAPYLGAEHVRVRSDGFDERGGDGFGLRAVGWDAQRSQAIGGLRARWEAPGLTLYGYGEWQHTLASSGFDLQASFTGIDAWAPISGMTPARSGGIAGIAFASWLSPRTQMGFGIDQRFGPRGNDRMASLRFAHGF